MLENRRPVPIVQSLAAPGADRGLDVNRLCGLVDLASGPTGEVHDEAKLVWCLSSLPWNAFNVVGHCELADDEIDAEIVEKQKYFRARGRPLVWWSTPYTR